MSVVAVIQVDFAGTPLGTRNRLAEKLAGVPVLRRTVERVLRVEGLDSVIVLCAPAETGRCRDLLDRLDGDSASRKLLIRPVQADPPPWRSLVRTARKWSLDSWRGGIGGTTQFDEYTDCRVINPMLAAVDAQAVLSVPPGAVVFDPALAGRMIGHFHEKRDETRLTFVQSPPGLAGVLLDVRLVRELAEKNVPLSWVFSYKPDHPQKDFIFQPCRCPVPLEVRHASGRLIADTDSAWRTLTDLLRDYENLDAITVGRWLLKRESSVVPPLPREVEIELTTDDPYPRALLRPRGDRVGPRGPIDLEIVQRIAQELEGSDDSLVVLGGFGDPLRHPTFPGVLRALRPNGETARVYGITLRTAGVDLTDESIEALTEFGVDVIEVLLDAWSEDLYAQLHSPVGGVIRHEPIATHLGAMPKRSAGMRSDGSFLPSGEEGESDGLSGWESPEAKQAPGRCEFSAALPHVIKRLDRLTAMKQERRSACPIVVPSFIKARENLRELDEFHDGWLRRVGAVAVHGYSRHAGQLEDRSVLPMAPAPRTACRRLWTRCIVLADGSVALCDQDFRGRCVLGHLGKQSLSEIWQGARAQEIRAAHRENRFDVTPLCAACEEWHRP